MKVKGVITNIEKPYDFGPEIIKVDAQFELSPQTLTIIAEFTNQGVDFRVSILFSHIEGFRVLDEGDLLNYWDHDHLPEEWIWQIIEGGWYDDERKNDNVTILSARKNELTEYLVTGVGMCVSVICSGEVKPSVKVLD